GMTLTFLLDTGVKETILFALANDTRYLHNQNKISFRGFGIGKDIEGILSTGNIVTVGGVAIDTLHSVYVVQAHDLDIASDIGTAVNGILDSKFFNSFPIRMNYPKSTITIYPPGYNYERKFRKHRITNVEIENDRPYIQAQVQFGQTWTEGKFLIDMGNTDALMLFPFAIPNFSVSAPYVDEYLGRGFNGPIHGTSVTNLTLAKIMDKLQSQPGDEIRLELMRNDEIIKTRFRLVDPIPYRAGDLL